ncbi:MAG: bifunctional riboflavin kinase/FAD synthetase [Thermodesulfobacteriota bacterium]|nr:bifunctional riboflavin kinase/FAD synthetase [Thermodesulfobacteriota bacterium]
MHIIFDIEQLEKPLKNPVLTIGNFDGVHKGHLVLFDKVKEKARDIKGQSVIITFDPHPIKIMRPGNGPPLITPTRQKLELIGDAEIDTIVCIPFTKQFAAISARDFIRKILVDKIGIKEIVVGYDYTFGHDREGNIQFLKEIGDQLGFGVTVVEPVFNDNSLVSSTSIRNLVQEGNLSDAKKLLGRDYQICGTVVSGKNRGGRILGFPTANLELIDELTPKVGVYAVRVLIDNQIHNGLTNIGYDPTFGDGLFSVETHILDFSKDLLDKTIRINFIKRLRNELTFNTVKDLADQIGNDIIRAREIFKTS